MWESEKASDASCHYGISPLRPVVETCVFCNCIFSAPSHSELQIEHAKGEHSVSAFLLWEGGVPKKQNNFVGRPLQPETSVESCQNMTPEITAALKLL